MSGATSAVFARPRLGMDRAGEPSDFGGDI